MTIESRIAEALAPIVGVAAANECAAAIVALPDVAVTHGISSAEYDRRDHASQRDGMAAFYPRSEYP